MTRRCFALSSSAPLLSGFRTDSRQTGTPWKTREFGGYDMVIELRSKFLYDDGVRRLQVTVGIPECQARRSLCAGSFTIRQFDHSLLGDSDGRWSARCRHRGRRSSRRTLLRLNRNPGLAEMLSGGEVVSSPSRRAGLCHRRVRVATVPK